MNTQEMIPSLVPGSGRSSGEQAAYQMAALGCTLVIAIASGTITGRVRVTIRKKGRDIIKK